MFFGSFFRCAPLLGYQKEGGGQLVKRKGGRYIVTEEDLTLGGRHTMQRIQTAYGRVVHLRSI